MIKTDNNYSIQYENNELAVVDNNKILRAIGCGRDPKLRPTSLFNTLQSASLVYGFDLDWDDITEAFRNPLFPIEESTPEEEVEELPPAPTFNELLENIDNYRRYAYEVLMSFCASNKNIENPPWLGVIAPPSTGKTFLLKLFDHSSVSLLVDDFTENALAAGTPNADAAEVSSMLDDAENKNLIMNDMSSVFSQRPEKVNKFIGGLTTAYGGTFVKYSPGTGAHRHNSNCTVIMGMTNRTYKKHRQYMSTLGNRFLFLTFKRPEFMRHRADTRAFDVDTLRKLTCAYQQKINTMENPILLDEVDDYLYNFVHKTIVLRNIRWITCWDELEGESRLYQEMIELCMTRAKIHDRTEVTIDDVNFFKPLAYETIPYISNINAIYKGCTLKNNNKWTKAMLLNARKLKLVECISEENSIVKAGFTTREIEIRTFQWKEEYLEYLDDMDVLYSSDDGDDGDDGDDYDDGDDGDDGDDEE